MPTSKEVTCTKNMASEEIEGVQDVFANFEVGDGESQRGPWIRSCKAPFGRFPCIPKHNVAAMN